MSGNAAKVSVKQGLFDNRMALSAREVADSIGVSVDALYVMVHRKQIPFHKRGKRLVFIPQEIQAWLLKKES